MKVDQEQITRNCALTMATLFSAGGLFLMLCWHLGLTSYLEVFECHWPIPYMATVTIFLCGIGFFAISMQKLNRFASVVGIMLLFVVFLEFVTQQFNVDFGIFEFLQKRISSESPKLNHMVEIGYIGMFFVGLYFIFWSPSNIEGIRTKITFLISLLIFFVGVLSGLSFILPFSLHFGLKEAFPIHCYTSAVLVLSSLLMIAMEICSDVHNELCIKKWRPIFTVIGCLFFTIFLTIGLRAQGIAFIDTAIQEDLDSARNETKETLEEAEDALIFISNYIIANKSVSETAYKNLLLEEIEPLIALKGLNSMFLWVNPNLEVEGMIPMNKSSLLNGSINSLLPMNYSSKTFLEKTQAFIEVIPKVRGEGYHLVLGNPVFQEGKLEEIVFLIVDAEDFFQKVLGKIIHKDYVVKIYSHHDEIAIFNRELIPQTYEWKETRDLTFLGANLRFDFYLTQAYGVIKLNNSTIYIILVQGFIASILAGFLVYLWQIGRYRYLLLEEEKKRFVEIEEERRLSLKAANVGVWSYDISTGKNSCDEFACYLMGLQFEEYKGDMESFLKNVVKKDQENLQNYFLKENVYTELLDQKFLVLWPNDGTHYLQIRGKVFYDEAANPLKIVGTINDITVLMRSQKFLEASEAISRASNGIGSLQEMARQLIHIFNNYWGWEVLVIWALEKDTDNLVCKEFEHVMAANPTSLEEACRSLKPLEKPTLIRKVWSSYKPVWIKELNKDPNYERAYGASKDHMHAVLAFPIFDGAKLAGVIELYSLRPMLEDLDENYFNFLTTIGSELGQFMKILKNQEELLQIAEIVTYSSEAIFHTNTEGIVQSWNEGAEKIYGWIAKEIVGQSITICYPKERISEFPNLLEKLKAGRAVQNFQTERRRKDGKIIWVENNLSPIKSSKGEVKAIAVISKDITAQKEMLVTLEKQEQKFHDFVETSEEWIWEVDAKMIYTYSNTYVERILGYSVEEVIGKQISYFIPEEKRRDVESDLELNIIRKKGWSKRSLQWLHKNGGVRVLEGNAEAIFNERHELMGFRGIERDITDMINLETSKNEFISMVSHELKTPLTSIYGSLGLLITEKQLPEEAKKLLDLAYRNTDRIIALVNDILDVTKIQMGQLEVVLRKISFLQVVREAILQSQTFAKRLGVTLVEEGEFIDVPVNGDFGRLVQVITNILSNAIKFSPLNSKIHITMECRGINIRLSVLDEGKGIPEDFSKKIFTIFSQADSSDTRSFQGSGLGLAISKNIMEQHGGLIGFTSQKDRGALFYIELPILKVER